MLTKNISLKDVQVKFEDESGIFSGYASVFNGVDSYNDTILPGAYKKVLKEETPKMFFNHNANALPIGKWIELQEDGNGLFVRGELTPGNPEAEAVKAALKHGTLDGLSIGYSLDHDGYTEKADGGRDIKEIKRLYEISVVTFPADKAARISEVKSEDIDEIKSIRDLENFLREAGGFSKSNAQALVAKAKSLISVQRDAEKDEKAMQEVLERVNRLRAKFQ